MDSSENISIPREKIEDFCKKHRIKRLSLFGSVLRDDFKPTSDIDVLVEFEHGHVVGYITFAGMELELSKIIGRKVDLRTPAELSHYFRQDVCNSAEVQYVQE
jgi:uncharacterized protein